MTFPIHDWRRCEAAGTPIYIQEQRPDWFVPNAAGDLILQKLARGEPVEDISAQRFLTRLPAAAAPPYPGRAALLALTEIRELWLHVTDRCNQTCRHCLFASGPGQRRELAAARLLTLAHQAAELGCRAFAVTGGEPLAHREFTAIMDGLLGLPGARVTVLTNGVRLPELTRELEHWPRERLHWQISVDGLPAQHDRQRGAGAWAALEFTLGELRARGWAFTLAMGVNAANVADMAGVAAWAAARGADNLHFIWHFQRGRGRETGAAAPADIFTGLKAAVRQVAGTPTAIDNLDTWRSYLFTAPGTKHDGATAGWESLAVGPDGRLYPSPALVGVKALATEISPGLAAAWRNSPVLEELRRATVAQMESPLKFLLGGGDPDHSYLTAGTWVGGDPYWPLYEQAALWLIAREAQEQPEGDRPGLRLKMGEVLESCETHGEVALTRTTCLLAPAAGDSRRPVADFYRHAAATVREDILNPVGYPEAVSAHIPAAARRRSYGCGSPVLAAALQEGERVLDLGCGPGLECFIAARLVGPEGRVLGVDMLPPMLAAAREGAAAVARTLGYDNLEFRQGFLEELPLEADSVDVALSNCVINLSSHKRRTFREIARVLKPGGRLVIADVVCEQEPPAALRNDEVLRGQCIAGALTQRDLFGLLEECGFVGLQVRGRFPYRTVNGHPFFSLTFTARKPGGERRRRVIYRGPFAALVTGRGELLPVGQTREIPLDEAAPDMQEVFVLGAAGEVNNVALEASGCCPAPEGGGCCGPPVPGEVEGPPGAAASPPLHRRGCVVCGEPLDYGATARLRTCHYCGMTLPAAVGCRQGHFVCDACHSPDALAYVRRLATHTRETDLIALLAEARRHPAIPVHGPEHHFLVPGIILAAYRNRGGRVTPEMLETALSRGRAVPGGSCAYLGVCGAGSGVGAAFGVLLAANPVTPGPRQAVQSIAARVLARLSGREAARCCQRECWEALKVAAELSREYLDLPLAAAARLVCTQAGRNRECIKQECPLWPGEGRLSSG